MFEKKHRSKALVHYRGLYPERLISVIISLLANKRADITGGIVTGGL